MLLRWLTPVLVLLTAAAVHTVDKRRAADAGGNIAAAPIAAAGVRAVMDPATGEIVGQPEAADLTGPASRERVRRRRAEELESFDLPSGARGVVLEGWADHATRLERGADGVLRLVCLQGDRHGEER